MGIQTKYVPSLYPLKKDTTNKHTQHTGQGDLIHLTLLGVRWITHRPTMVGGCATLMPYSVNSSIGWC